MDKVTNSQRDSASIEEVLTNERRDFDNEKEQSLIENIKRLAHENKSIKLGLAKHNKLIEVCTISHAVQKVKCLIDSQVNI